MNDASEDTSKDRDAVQTATMTQRWAELRALASAAGVRIVDGRPTFKRFDLFLWDPDDLAGWVAAALECDARLIYAAERTLADRAEVLEEELDEVAFELSDELIDEVDAITKALGELVGQHGDEQLGWSAEWRFGGVAHVLGYLDDPPEVKELAGRISMVRGSRNRGVREGWEERRRREQAEQVARFDTAAATLAAHPTFASCKNLAERKNLLKRLEVNTDGLNKEDVISEATRLARETRSAAAPGQLSLTDPAL